MWDKTNYNNIQNNYTFQDNLSSHTLYASQCLLLLKVNYSLPLLLRYFAQKHYARILSISRNFSMWLYTFVGLSVLSRSEAASWIQDSSSRRCSEKLTWQITRLLKNLKYDCEDKICNIFYMVLYLFLLMNYSEISLGYMRQQRLKSFFINASLVVRQYLYLQLLVSVYSAGNRPLQ